MVHGYSLPKGEAAFNKLFLVYKRNAKRYKRDFELSKEEFRELTKQNCFYCGTEPIIGYNADRRSHGKYLYNGVDRYDNSKGYTVDNAVPCCKICNTMKSNLDVDAFRNHIKKIYNKL